MEGPEAIEQIVSTIRSWLLPLSGVAFLVFPVAILLWTVIPNCCQSRAVRKDEAGKTAKDSKDDRKPQHENLGRSAMLPQRERLWYCSMFFASCIALLLGLRASDFLMWHWHSNDDKVDALLQPLWASIINQAPSWLVSHFAFGGVVGMVSFFASCIYFTLLDVFRSESKIQKDWWPSLWDILVAAVPQSLIYVSAAVGAYKFVNYNLVLPLEAPHLCVFLEELIIAFVVGDFLMYWEHRIMHMVPYLRMNIHSVHHMYHAPFGWAGGVVHPAEDALVVICQTITPVLCGHHPLSFWTFIFFWVIFLVEEHSGHDVCWAPYNWLPFARCPLGSGAAPHDIHHYKVTKNYGFVLCVWDQLFGTSEKVVQPPDLPKARAETWWEHQSHMLHECEKRARAVKSD